MKWDVVLDRALDAILAHAVLGPLFGTRVVKAGPWSLDALPEMPRLEWTLVADSEDELWAPCIFQFDIWARNEDDLLTGERWLRRLFHQDLPFALGSGDAAITMWGQYTGEKAELATPDRDGFYGRAIRFRFTPLRDRYEPVLPPS